MKRVIMIVMGIALLSACASSSKRQMLDVNQDKYIIEGTWEHSFDDAPQNTQIKILSRTHFVWVTYERSTGMPLLLAGGTYRFDGKTYIEKVEFGSPGIPQELIGKEQVFTAMFEGDQWYHEGILTNGFHVRELWEKID